MNKLFLVGALLISQFAFAASSNEGFKLIHVKDLIAMMADKTNQPVILDANTPDTRKEDGTIPGAKLLPSSKGYDVSKTLPSDKNTNLVFYCANTKCMASHAAAEKAVNAGYKNVAVMADGIEGWNKETKKKAQTSTN